MKPFTEELKFTFPDLNSESVVIDAGAHEGNWSHEMWTRYGCKIVALEPIPRYIHESFLRLENTNATIIPMALGATTRLERFKMHGAMSGLYADGVEQVVGVIGIDHLCHNLTLGKVAVLKLNIEGGEFEVLEHILRTEMTHGFQNIIVQPHTCVPDFEKRWKAIDERLKLTHELVFHEDWCWSGYKLRA